MTIIAVRHEFSSANNRENYGTPAFDNSDAGLEPLGLERAPLIGYALSEEYGIDLASETVAVSMMRRNQETAIAAGFKRLHLYPELNEEKGDLKGPDVLEALRNRNPPTATMNAARYLIENPPAERIWFAHGFLIAAICKELGVYQNERFVPAFGEIRELPIIPGRAAYTKQPH